MMSTYLTIIAYFSIAIVQSIILFISLNYRHVYRLTLSLARSSKTSRVDWMDCHVWEGARRVATSSMLLLLYGHSYEEANNNNSRKEKSFPGSNLLSSLASRRVAICLSGAETSESICGAIHAEFKIEWSVVVSQSQQHQRWMPEEIISFLWVNNERKRSSTNSYPFHLL